MDRRPLLAALLALGLPAAAGAASEDADKVEAEVRITFEVDIENALLAETGTTATRLSREAVEKVRRKVIEQTIQVLGDRLTEIGIEEHRVEAASGDRVVAVIPRTDKPAGIRKLLQKVGALEIRLVRFPMGGDGTSRDAVLQNYGGRVPPELELLEGEIRNARGVPTGKWYFAVERKRLLTGRDLEQAYVEKRPPDDKLFVVFALAQEAIEPFYEVTGANVDVPLAIVLDGKVISAHPIGEAIHGAADIEMSGPPEAESLAAVLSSGPLPAPVTVVEEHVIFIPPSPEWRSWSKNLIGLLVWILLLIGVLVAIRRWRHRPS